MVIRGWRARVVLTLTAAAAETRLTVAGPTPCRAAAVLRARAASDVASGKAPTPPPGFPREGRARASPPTLGATALALLQELNQTPRGNERRKGRRELIRGGFAKDASGIFRSCAV